VFCSLSQKNTTPVFFLLSCLALFFFQAFLFLLSNFGVFFKLTEVPFYRPSFMLHGQQSPSSGFPATTFLHQALLLSTNGTIFLTCLVKDQLPAKNVLGFPFFFSI
jgi:hypothetical protein